MIPRPQTKLPPKPPIRDETLVTVADIVRETGLSYTCAKRWTTAVDFPEPKQIGRRVYWNRKEVEEFFAEH